MWSVVQVEMKTTEMQDQIMSLVPLVFGPDTHPTSFSPMASWNYTRRKERPRLNECWRLVSRVKGQVTDSDVISESVIVHGNEMVGPAMCSG